MNGKSDPGSTTEAAPEITAEAAAEAATEAVTEAVTESATEADLVRERYARRAPHDPRYSLLNPAALMSMQERQRSIARLLVELGRSDPSRTDPSSLHLLEVGCGDGGNLLELLRLGFAPHRLAGIELLADRHAVARERLPAAVALQLGDAATAPVAEASQDIVFQSTVFSSLLDGTFQQRLADRMWRWVKPGGGVLWYDFTVDNPRNPDVRGVPLSRLRALFPDGTMQARRVTLAPPLARAVCRVHPSLYTLFNTVPLLRTHVLAWIAKA